MYYIKKPLPVTAIKIPKTYSEEWLRTEAPQWLIDAFLNKSIKDNGSFLTIETLEGPMMCKYGYWIIKGVRGELYGCRPDVFEESYEPYT